MNLTDLTSAELFELYDDRWAAYCAARASYYNAIREKVPELVEKYHLQTAKFGRTLDEILKEIERKEHEPATTISNCN